jgi:hypothetical protein
MTNEETDPLARKAHADLIIERAAEQLRHLLQEAVHKLDSFPPFPGAFFTYGIEVEPGALASSERGCVVLGPDAELYELEVEIDFSQGAGDAVDAREERLKKLDLPPCDYVVYAYHALTRVVELLLEQNQAK